MSETNWNEWNHTSACLRSIEVNAKWIAQYSARIQHAVTELRTRPDFETRAADQLEKTLESLQLTVALCRAALEEFDHKPTGMALVGETAGASH